MLAIIWKDEGFQTHSEKNTHKYYGKKMLSDEIWKVQTIWDRMWFKKEIGY
jgi:hypothetical protein